MHNGLFTSNLFLLLLWFSWIAPILPILGICRILLPEIGTCCLSHATPPFDEGTRDESRFDQYLIHQAHFIFAVFYPRSRVFFAERPTLFQGVVHHQITVERPSLVLHPFQVNRLALFDRGDLLVGKLYAEDDWVAVDLLGC